MRFDAYLLPETGEIRMVELPRIANPGNADFCRPVMVFTSTPETPGRYSSPRTETLTLQQWRPNVVPDLLLPHEMNVELWEMQGTHWVAMFTVSGGSRSRELCRQLMQFTRQADGAADDPAPDRHGNQDALRYLTNALRRSRGLPDINFWNQCQLPKNLKLMQGKVAPSAYDFWEASCVA